MNTTNTETQGLSLVRMKALLAAADELSEAVEHYTGAEPSMSAMYRALDCYKTQRARFMDAAKEHA